MDAKECTKARRNIEVVFKDPESQVIYPSTDP